MKKLIVNIVALVGLTAGLLAQEGINPSNYEYVTLANTKVPHILASNATAPGTNATAWLPAGSTTLGINLLTTTVAPAAATSAVKVVVFYSMDGTHWENSISSANTVTLTNASVATGSNILTGTIASSSYIHAKAIKIGHMTNMVGSPITNQWLKIGWRN